MALASSTVIAIGGLIVGAAGAYMSYEARQDAKAEAGRSRAAQEKSANEQRAKNAAQQAAERRAQLRNERVRRSQIDQIALNTGGWGGSSQNGAIGSMATQLSSNIGQNLGAINSANRQSGYAQDQANAQFGMQNAMSNMQGWQSFSQLGFSAMSYGASRSSTVQGWFQ